MTRKKTLRLEGFGDLPSFTIKDLDEFVDFSRSVSGNHFLFSVLADAANKRKFDRWLRSIGEHKFADILLRFKNTTSLYADAVEVLHDNLKKEKEGFENVVGCEDAIQILMERTVFANKCKKISRMYDKDSSGAILLYGPPGCGKTMLADALAGETGKFFVKRNVMDVSESTHTLKYLFNLIRTLEDSVLFIDEIEALAVNRDYQGMDSRMFANALLTEINMSEQNKGMVVIGATNCPWLIDPAMLRSGRFDCLHYVGVPDGRTREKLFRFYTKGMPIGDINMEELVLRTDFYSCSDIKNVCQEAATIPWREAVAGKEPREIRQDDFEKALLQVDSTTAPWFDNAMGIVLQGSMIGRFEPMMAEIKRYKMSKGRSRNCAINGGYA